MCSPLACPSCHAPLDDRTTSRWRCALGHQFPVVLGAARLLDAADPNRDERVAADFERLYQVDAEPWHYTRRGAEILKYRFLLDAVRGLCGGSLRGRVVIDVGCSLGGLAIALAGAGANVLAIDLSETAVRRAQAAFAESGGRGLATFAVGSATRLPCAPGAADVIVLSDGLRTWKFNREQRLACLESVARVLRPNGAALFLDYMHPRHFREFTDAIDQAPLRVARVHYLGDRLFYNVERAARKTGLLQRKGFFNRLVASARLARILAVVSGLLGSSGSKHLCVVAHRA